jgi:hypothetical protein
LFSLAISPAGRLFVEKAAGDSGMSPDPIAGRIAKAFGESVAHGLLHLATVELQTPLASDLGFARDFAREYLTALCHTPDLESAKQLGPLCPPADEALQAIAVSAPPMQGAEYLHAETLAGWWKELDSLVRHEATAWPDGIQAYLRHKNPLWRLVGRVTFHLAENKRDEQHPFAFLATYTSRLSSQGRPQHKPLGQALTEYAGAKNRAALVALLRPIQEAATHSPLAKALVESSEVYQAQAWTPAEAYRFLREIPLLEQSGLIVRVPDWWKPQRPPRPTVNVKIGEHGVVLGADSLLDFSVAVALDGEPLSDEELQSLLNSHDEFVSLKGRWVEVDREKLSAALKHWKRVEKEARDGGISFFEGMRLLAGVNLPGDSTTLEAVTASWSGIVAGAALDETLRELRNPTMAADAEPVGLHTRLRPYQQVGVKWLRFVTRLGLGACLADDMGLGKTIQVIALLLDIRHRSDKSQPIRPSLLVVPASLLANWQAELRRFAPSLSALVVHPAEIVEGGKQALEGDAIKKQAVDSDLVITSYGMLTRLAWLREQRWNLVILDEAQAIKNSATRQSRGVKQLQASARIALTGTPVENRLSDLWSLFDFLNPGLLGSATAFAKFTKQLASDQGRHFGPLRALIQPYMLRRLKTDKQVIADLPEKTEMNAFCSLSKHQAALYEQTVAALAEALRTADGIKRRGIVLASLMRLKQICNHPSQAVGDAGYEPDRSGKFDRLSEICTELAARQQKVLIFTQFREITAPLAEFLTQVFGRPGLVLHGQTAVGKRRELVQAFQREDGPPFFVLSLKAGGVGLNLTAASHVIHFDRWWNPAVENQATDRAFRIGQQRNVLVYKFVCRGTIEERIDELIAAKRDLAKDLIEGTGEQLLTEMDTEQLLRFVSLDMTKALASS